MTSEQRDRLVEETGAIPEAQLAATDDVKPTRSFLLNRFLWAMASFGSSFVIKLMSNVVLSRLLAPEIFGIMVVVNSLKVGIELLTDVGIEQNIVHNEKGLYPAFFNTAWTLQMMRGFFLSSLFLCISPFISTFYRIDVRIFLLISLVPFINSLHSTSIFALVKQLEVKRRNIFEFIAEFLNFAICCGLAFISPTVWSLLFGVLLATGLRSALSYLLPHPAHRPTLHGDHVREILRFGRWIAVSSFVMYAANNADRLSLGKVAPLAVLGIYGIARTISELPSTLSSKLSYQLIFPVLAATRAGDDAAMLRDLRASRMRLILLAAFGIAGTIAWTDWAVRLLYDVRYREAGWMLSMMLFGAWFSVLSNLNEGVLLGSGRPAYLSVANVVRLLVLLVGLPFGYLSLGFAGAILAVILGEVVRYAAVGIGQLHMRLSFWRQDAVATMAMFAVVIAWILLRHALGLGTPWDGIALHPATR